ncbi:hypothetical protein V8C35DRAFT_333333 [Trichoderma chlorosporum]
MPATVGNDEETVKNPDHARRTTSHGGIVPKGLPSRGNNRESTNPGISVSQHPNANGKKRSRLEDEDDELSRPGRQTRTRISVTSVLENWEMCLVRQLVQRDPEVICNLLNSSRINIARLHEQIASLQSEIEREGSSHEDEIFTLNEENKTLRIEMERLLTSNTSDFGTKKASDDTIRSIWWKLSYKVKNIVSNYFTEWPEEDTVFINGIKYDRNTQLISADEMIDLQRSLQRRQLWRALFHNIFSGNGKDCHGNIGGTFARLLSKQNPNGLPDSQYLQMISKMKSALDLDLKEKGEPSSRVCLEQLVQATVAHFKHLVVSKKLYEFEEDLKKIFRDAWQLHTDTMASKAIFIMQWSEYGDENNTCHYNPDTMEFFGSDDTTSASDRTIGVIETPLLWKIGNGDGENFDSTMILCKHCVFPWENKNESSVCTLDESSS